MPLKANGEVQICADYKCTLNRALQQHMYPVPVGCILWGSSVIVLSSSRPRVLESLHEGHPRIVRMKALARSYLWWPGLDKAIEAQVHGCYTCQQSRPEMPQAPVHRWEDTHTPWSRIHIDFAGPFQGQLFLIVVDSHSKWLEVAPVPTMTTARTIQELRRIFATHGLPDMLVSDNGAQFTASEFQSFLRANLIRHAILADFLLCQRTTPCTTTGRSPAELRWGRLITKLHRLHPDRVASDSAQPKAPQNLQVGDWVWTRNYGQGALWVAAVVVKVSGPLSYEVVLEDGRVIRQHIDQLRWRLANQSLAQASQEGRMQGPCDSSPTEELARSNRTLTQGDGEKAVGELPPDRQYPLNRTGKLR
ncbi:uncharacterized protein K02A2.6-like [Protobothrops mucrosquamatus]|uniref:uncharacterized protein K02A2.6-like n=1 Tax=Protobothrops mucrosquamatus TaxID=103944 RepID=UPI0010FB99BD|nr:uncharacterized protein K02A2.6-like [Protobothrops mucrosquamatus]